MNIFILKIELCDKNKIRRNEEKERRREDGRKYRGKFGNRYQ